MIDGLMTELCKSFNPFIKLNRGALDALYPRTSAHLASVKDTQHLQTLWEGPDRSWWHAALRAFMRHDVSSTVFMWHIKRRRRSLTFTLIMFPRSEFNFFLSFCPEICVFFPKTRVRKYCTRQTRIYMCCQWVQTAGISVVLWPYGSENSLRPVTECLGYSRVSVIYGSVSRSSDSLSSSFTQERFISWRKNPLRDTNSHAKHNDKAGRFHWLAGSVIQCRCFLWYYKLVWHRQDI